MKKGALLGLVIAVLPAPSLADDSDLAALASVVTEACLFDSLDFNAEYQALTTAMEGTGLPVVMAQEKTSVFGDMTAMNIVVARKIDELSCFMRIPAPMGTKEVFSDFQAKMDAVVDTAFPKHLEEADSDPSPHVDGHDWVASFPGKMHYAVSLDWGTETGLQLAVGFRQLYE